MHGWIRFAFVTAALSLCGHAAAGQVPPYRVLCIAPDVAVPLAMNGRDDVTGYIVPSNNWPLSHAFVWSPTTGLQHLNTASLAYDINDRGQLAGVNHSYDFVSGGVWESNQWIALGVQEARAINNRGQAIGLICTQPACAPLPYRGFRDDDIHAPGYLQLATPAPTDTSHALDINDFGEVVGNYYAYTPHVRQFAGLFYPTNGPCFVLNDNGAYTTWPIALNERHEIAGRALRSENALVEAVYWSSPTGAVEYLAALGASYSAAWGINNRGEIVGESDKRAFLWTRETGTLDLNTLIDPALGIVLTKAVDINDRGSIAAQGNAGGKQYAYLLIRPDCPPAKWYVTTIAFSNRPDGDGDVTYFTAGETLFVRVCDVDLAGPRDKARVEVQLRQKGARPVAFELTHGDDCYEGNVPLTAFHAGTVDIEINSKHATASELKRKAEIHILPTP